MPWILYTRPLTHLLLSYTGECHYSAVQFNMILHMVRQWLRKNTNQRLFSQKTHQSSPVRASYGVSLRIWNKIDRVITAPHCTLHCGFITPGQGLTLSVWLTCPSGTWFWKFTCPAKICMCPANICTSPVKLMYTAGKISTCPDWKITCPVGHVTTKVWVP